uniref:Uncharacterized protein n=1 Tax=Cyprinus carpio TaxID=7962 RepID=A0A8C1VL37_CYPCA
SVCLSVYLPADMKKGHLLLSCEQTYLQMFGLFQNIELKVEVESLKQELQEKQHLTAAESLTNHNEAELQRRCEERQQEIDHMQQVLESKIQILQEEAQLARDEAELRVRMTESHLQHPSVTMEMVPKETSGDMNDQSIF